VKLKGFKDFFDQNVVEDFHISCDADSGLSAIHYQSIIGCDLKFCCEEIELTRIRVSESVKESYEPNIKEIKNRLSKTKNSENKG
jgi:hypothetical protein